MGREERRLLKTEERKRRHSSDQQTGGVHEGLEELQPVAVVNGRNTRRQQRSVARGGTGVATSSLGSSGAAAGAAAVAAAGGSGGTASRPRAPRPPPGQRREEAARRAQHGARRQSGGAPQQDSDDDTDDESFHESSVTESSLSEEDLEQESASSDASTDYSDWGDNNLTPPQRTAKKSAKAAASQPATSEDDNDKDENEKESKPGPSRYFRRKKYDFDPQNLEEIPASYLPSPWLAEFVPKKTPYFPQMGDEVMYFKQGHMGYINLVKHRDCYKFNMREQQWLKREDLRQTELVKVVGMKYDIRPPRLCCLKLAILEPGSNELTGKTFNIKYHDMNDVVDFLVLRHNYEQAINIKWSVGDR